MKAPIRAIEQIVLDLRQLTFIDSAGLRLLLRLDVAARSSHCPFAIIDGSDPVRRLLDLTCPTDPFANSRA